MSLRKKIIHDTRKSQYPSPLDVVRILCGVEYCGCRPWHVGRDVYHILTHCRDISGLSWVWMTWDRCYGEKLRKAALHQRVIPRDQDNDDEWIGRLMRKETDVQMNAECNDCDDVRTHNHWHRGSKEEDFQMQQGVDGQTSIQVVPHGESNYCHL